MPTSVFDTRPFHYLQLRLSTSVAHLKGPIMPLIQGASAPRFSLPHATFTGLAAPSRGSLENSVWRVELAPHAEPVPHSLSREEIFVAVSGKALADIDGEKHEINPGDALIVPAGRMLSLGNPHPEP